MKLSLKKITKIAATAFTLYKANQEEVDSALAWAKRKVAKKKHAGY